MNYKSTKIRWLNLAHALADMSLSVTLADAGIYSLLGGLSVYGVSSYLLYLYFPYIFSKEYHFEDELAKSLAGYCEDEYGNVLMEDGFVFEKNYREDPENVSPGAPSVTWKYGTVLIDTEDNLTDVVVEHIGCDIGGYVRAFYSLNKFLQGEGIHRLMVLIVDNYDDAYNFRKFTGSFNISEKFCIDGFKVYFLLQNDIGRKNRLFDVDSSGLIVYYNGIVR